MFTELNQPYVDSFFDVFTDWGQALYLDSFFDINVDLGNEYTDYDFGNFEHGVFNGYKWSDLDGDGVWDEDEEGIPDWHVGLGIEGDAYFDESEKLIIPIEIIALSLTGSGGAFNLPYTAPGNYVVVEENRMGWNVTNPANRDSFFDVFTELQLNSPLPDFVPDSFFDVFAELGGQEITEDTEGNMLRFGNREAEVSNDDGDNGGNEGDEENGKENGNQDETGGGGEEQGTATQVTQCNDGVDNDHDTWIDYPEAGCDSPSDDNEAATGNGGSNGPPGGGGGSGVAPTVPDQGNGGEVLGAFTSREEEIAAIRAAIAELQEKLLGVLNQLLTQLLNQMIAHLQAQLNALLAS
ncbi:hypothetical protein HYT01_00180 [Candidatus Giovannonibacteria bacterium]|nr:hypothetical protein [Candidatus Giovannonibacteria bacterium]